MGSVSSLEGKEKAVTRIQALHKVAGYATGISNVDRNNR